MLNQTRGIIFIELPGSQYRLENFQC